MLSGVRLIIAGTLVEWGAYLLFVATVNWPELLVGVCCAAMVTSFVVRSTEPQPVFVFRLRWLSRFPKLPLEIARDSAKLIRVLFEHLLTGRPLRGEYRTIPFDLGGDSHESEARRAFALVGLSIAPNTVSVVIDDNRSEILLHQLVPTQSAPGNGDRELPV